MADLLTYVPVAATAFAVPQFVPQIRRLCSTGDTVGVSWPWAALTCVNNAAWTVYFVHARYWTALVASVSVAVLAGLLAIMLTVGPRRALAASALVPRVQASVGRSRVPVGSRSLILLASWIGLLVTAWAVGGGAGLGMLLTAGFVVQVTPPLWAAYRVTRPTGVSTGTWLLIFAELACWLLYGVQESDPRVITLGAAGVVASALMLVRIWCARSMSESRRGRELGNHARCDTRVSTMS